jgi:hypothetical protein
MQNTWFSALAAWWNPLRNLAWNRSLLSDIEDVHRSVGVRPSHGRTRPMMNSSATPH